MAFCTKCGKPLASGANFCSSCGNPVVLNTIDNGQSDTVKEGKIHVCPSCSAKVNAFLSKCPYCNHEFRDSKPAGSISKLSGVIQGIDSRNMTPFTDALDSIGISMGANYRKIDAVRSCPIPNTREDIIEFALMANANIDEGVYAQPVSTRTQISDAWLNKLEQAYQKARLTLGDDSAVEMIGDMYRTKSEAVAKNKRRFNTERYTLLIACFLLLFLLLAFVAFRAH